MQRAALVVLLCVLLARREATASGTPSCCQHSQPQRDLTSPHSSHLENIVNVSFAPYETALSRDRRESRSLIAPFDISKMWKKKIKMTAPSASSLRSERVVGEPLASTAPTIISNDNAKTSTETSMAFDKQWEDHTAAPFRKSAPKIATKKSEDMLTGFKYIESQTKHFGSESATQATTQKTMQATRHETRLLLEKENETAPAWPVKHAATLEGDIILGGLMMVRVCFCICSCLNCSGV